MLNIKRHDKDSNADDQVANIIGQIPTRIITLGSSVIFLIIIVILIFSTIVKYPDIITAPITCSATTVPVKIIAHQNGRIINLFKVDKSTIKAGDLIAILENDAVYSDVQYCRQLLDSLLSPSRFDSVALRIKLPSNLQLGSLQSDYTLLYQTVNNYILLKKTKFYEEKGRLISGQRMLNRQKQHQNHFQDSVLKDQIKLDEWKDSVNSSLLRDKVISLAEYNESKRIRLGQLIIDQDRKTSLNEFKSQETEYMKNSKELNQLRDVDLNNSLLSLVQAAQKFRGSLAQWDKNYLFISPVSGELNFYRIEQVNQYVTEAEPVFVVVPKSTNYYLLGQLSPNKIGKIKVGQTANIKLTEFPYSEFGMLKGSVSSITYAPMDSTYSIHLKLDQGFVTTLGVVLEPRPLLFGTADLVTDDKTIFRRLFESFYSAIH